MLFAKIRRYIPLLTFTIVMIIAFFSVVNTNAGFTVGDSRLDIEGAGTKENPFVIYTFEGL